MDSRQDTKAGRAYVAVGIQEVEPEAVEWPNPYIIEVWENNRLLDRHRIPDPFITTKVTLGGWLTALRVLLHRQTVEVRVHAPSDLEDQVMELNPDFLGGPHSKSRQAWNAQLERAFTRLVDGDD